MFLTSQNQKPEINIELLLAITLFLWKRLQYVFGTLQYEVFFPCLTWKGTILQNAVWV